MKDLLMETIQDSSQPLSVQDLVAVLRIDQVKINELVADLREEDKLQMVYRNDEWHYYPSGRPIWYDSETDQKMHALLKGRGSISHFEASTILSIPDADALGILLRLCGQLRAAMDISKGTNFFKYAGVE